jgi:hypothetical protein
LIAAPPTDNVTPGVRLLPTCHRQSKGTAMKRATMLRGLALLSLAISGCGGGELPEPGGGTSEAELARSYVEAYNRGAGMDELYPPKEWIDAAFKPPQDPNGLIGEIPRSRKRHADDAAQSKSAAAKFELLGDVEEVHSEVLKKDSVHFLCTLLKDVPLKRIQFKIRGTINGKTEEKFVSVTIAKLGKSKWYLLG